jgi:dihydroxyacetone kinase-like protein
MTRSTPSGAPPGTLGHSQLSFGIACQIEAMASLVWHPQSLFGIVERLRMGEGESRLVADDRYDGAFVARWIRDAAAAIAEQRDYLTQLDAAIGDADHGVNMDRGFARAVELLDVDAPPGGALEQVGTALVLSVGGAAGPLYGSSIREMGRALGDAETLGGEDLLRMLRVALDEIQRLGAASVGDKTMVDALAPAIDAFERGLRTGERVPVALARATVAAEEGAASTVPLQARRGRASYLGARSVGHLDPGAASSALLISALERAAGASA